MQLIDCAVRIAQARQDQRQVVWRNREEELLGVLQVVKSSPRPVDGTGAVVFQRPLPYLYLARHLFARYTTSASKAGVNGSPPWPGHGLLSIGMVVAPVDSSWLSGGGASRLSASLLAGRPRHLT